MATEPLVYEHETMELSRHGSPDKTLVKALQRDLRALGYLATAIDGFFGPMTESAVRALEYDLIHNDGHGSDGGAPVRIVAYNRQSIAGSTGVVDKRLAACIREMLNDDRFPKLPSVSDPHAENGKIDAIVRDMTPRQVPPPFLLAILAQESDGRQYQFPTADNDDRFVVVGLDHNGETPCAITSRGYGVSQFTLFHHPPRQTEMDGFIANTIGNVQKGIAALLEKFNGFVNGPTPDFQADDRIQEIGKGPLRKCRSAPTDPRYMADCRQCMVNAGKQDIRAGVTPWYDGADGKFAPTQYHGETHYIGVPIRRNIPCDWPYAARRYNGSGFNSYHYQVQVLLRVLKYSDI